MFKKIVKYTVWGILWGCLFTEIINAIGSSIVGIRWFRAMPYGYAGNLLASAIVGIGWVLPSMIYENQKMGLGIRTLIHLTIGLLVQFPTAFVMGWIPRSQGIGTLVMTMLLMILIAVIIWFFFALFYRREARKMNKQIKKMK